MAKRRNVFRFKSDAVQGQGSYVELRSPEWGELKAFSNDAASAEPVKPDKPTDDEGAGFAMYADDGVAVDEVTEETAEPKASTALERQLVALVIAWDWVDGDDRPLPLPKDDPGVVQRLTAREIAFLNDCLVKLIAPPKN